MDFRPQNTTPS